MGLNFKFIVIWKAFSTMSSGSSVPIRTSALRPFGSAGSKDASSATPPAAPKDAPVAPPKATPVAAPPAAPKAAKQCHEFRDSQNPCSRRNCWDANCRNAKAKLLHTASPKHSAPPKAAGGGDDGVAAQLAAMEKQISARLDGIESKIDSGFNEQRKLSLELQAQGSKSYAETMNMFNMFGKMMTGGFAAIKASPLRPELPAPPVRSAICGTPSSTVTEVREGKSFARGGGSVESSLTGADIDPYMGVCLENGFLDRGMLFKALCGICGKTGLSDYHRELISSIGKVTKDDNLVALLFLLLTGSKQFRNASFSDFRTSCDTMLGSNWANTRTAFSNVCDHMLKSMRDWQIAKKSGISVSNGDLKDKSKRESVFDTLVRNFQS